MSKFKIDDKVYIRKHDYLGFITGINKEEDLYLIDNPYSEYSFQLNEDELTLLKEGDKDVIESTEVKEVLQNEQTLDDINCKYDTQNEYDYVCMDTGDFKIILDNQTTYLCKRHLLSFLLESSSMKFIIEKI